MDKFIYKKSAGITALSASMTDFKYKKHAHQEYAIGVTLRGIQHYNMDGGLQLSYQNGIMLFNPEQAHDGMAHDKTGLDYVMLYIEPQLLLDVIEKKDKKQRICFMPILNMSLSLTRSVKSFNYNCKIEYAKQLIEKNSDVYSAVAECGFVDLTHLNKHFKGVYGTTAFEYISQINGCAK